MRKRFFGLTLGAMLFALCFSVKAQQPGKVYRIGYLAPGFGIGSHEEAFRQRLRQLGYVEGENIVIEWQHAKGKLDRYPDLATDLVYDDGLFTKNEIALP
jgi:putative ABC transport system substrate-binding protein